MIKEMEDRYNDIIKEAVRTIEKYKTPDGCKNDQELNELEDAFNVLMIDELSHIARRTCEEDS